MPKKYNHSFIVVFIVCLFARAYMKDLDIYPHMADAIFASGSFLYFYALLNNRDNP